MTRNKLFFLGLFALLASCNPEIDKYEEIPAYEEGEESLTEHLARLGTNSNAFGRSIPGLDRSQNILFFSGNRLFNTAWVSAPSITSGLDGLGPTFNAKACENCHLKDGRGTPIIKNGHLSKGFLLRLSLPGVNAYGGPLEVPGYGDQLQQKSILNVPEEGQIEVRYESISGSFKDGTPYELLKPIYSIVDTNFGALNDVLTSPRVGTQTIGLGLIDAIPEDSILQYQDIEDLNKDGISGKANYVWDVQKESLSLGKFGWKANQPNLRQQVGSALHGDIGLTNALFPDANCPDPQNNCNEAPNGGEPEITETQMDRLTFYQSALAVPLRRNYKDEKVRHGKQLFDVLECFKCHRTDYTTGVYPFNPLLEGVTIKPYSDFLLHDMGEDLADNRPDYLANGREWRTQPLWGIGMIFAVNKHTNLLHDGRARNIEEAILWHGGEATTAKNAYTSLDKEKREALLSFLNSL